jgi:hypothetical protein
MEKYAKRWREKTLKRKENARTAHTLHTLNWYLNERNWIAQGRPKNPAMKKHFNSLRSWMTKHPINVNVPLYRGLKHNISQKLLHNKYLVNNAFPSFTKKPQIAKTFSGNNYPKPYGIVIVLNAGRYPAMQSNKRYHHKGEAEVTLAPGRFNLLKNKNTVKNSYYGNFNVYKVRYTPAKN